MGEAISVSVGFEDAERPLVARLYWQAFGVKLGRTLGPRKVALPFLMRVLNPQFALVARDADGTVLGLAGFKTADGGLVDAGLRDLARVYGWIGALWRALLLAALERRLQDGVLQMDGLLVSAEARGRGIGTRLLQAVRTLAETRGARAVQLNVIDINPRARALYERLGFRAVGKERTGPLRRVFGFAEATRMQMKL